MLYDADIFRAMMEIISMQAPPGEVVARPGPARAELIGVLA